MSSGAKRHSLAAKLYPLSRMRVAHKKSVHPKNIPPLEDIVAKFKNELNTAADNSDCCHDDEDDEAGELDEAKVAMMDEACEPQSTSSSEVQQVQEHLATTTADSALILEGVEEKDQKNEEEEEAVEDSNHQNIGDKLDRSLLEQNIKLQERVSALMLEITDKDELSITGELSKLMRSNSHSLPSVLPPNQSRSSQDRHTRSLEKASRPSSPPSLTSSGGGTGPLLSPSSPYERPWLRQYPSTQTQLSSRVKELEESIIVRKEEANKVNVSIKSLHDKVNALQFEVAQHR
jgi:hypothetical protein